jgi:hypothetical protein
MRRTLTIACFLASSAFAQSAPNAVPLAFDVASVRPSKPDAPQHNNVPLDAGNVYASISPDDARSAAGGLFIATHQALWRYVSFAYKLSGTQELALRFNIFSGAPKSGAPFWVTGSFNAAPEYFDIMARSPADTSIDQMRLMMQTLLVDRFHLVVHTLSADAPVFALASLSSPMWSGLRRIEDLRMPQDGVFGNDCRGSQTDRLPGRPRPGRRNSSRVTNDSLTVPKGSV